ncbi:MAG: flagellar hook capping protein [Firmicutes bacterium]|nr:flagellar hook capping protein [Bacillota bacterium]
MSISATSSSSSTSTTTSSSTATTSSLDFDEFIQLLATELKYQDPDDPVSGTEYVSQMAQISSLSALSTINSSLNNSTAFNMIGKEATYSTTDTSGNVVTGSGTVQSVTISGSSTYVNVGGTTVDLASITEVSDSSTTSST